MRPGGHRPALPVLVATVGLLVAGCTGAPSDAGPTEPVRPTSRVLQGAAPGGQNSLVTAIPEPPDYVTDADVAFIQAMLLHHAQALEMTALVPERTSRDDVPLFAERIQLSQEDEIRVMQEWLRARGEPIFDLSKPRGAHGHAQEQMAGMLTPAQMQELEAASGEEFDRLFLQYMYRHHEGAVLMVEELRAADGGQDDFVFQMAKDIDGDQRIEMDRMIEMLAEMGSAPLPAADG